LSIATATFAAQNVVVLLDDSGSMDDRMRGQSIRRIDAAKDALLTVLGQVPDDASVGVLALNGSTGRGEWIIELGPLDKNQVRDAVGRIRAQGGTPLGEFMKVAMDSLLQLREKQFYGDYRLLVVTDGEANDGPYLESILPDVLSRNIAVDVIGVDMQQDHTLATQVSSYRRADDPSSLTHAITESLAEVVANPDDEADESAYELLDGLPDDVASAVIGALVKNNNAPIDAQSGAHRGTYGASDPYSQSAQQGRSRSGSATVGGVLAFAFFLCMFIVFGFLVVVFKTMRRR
jgi:uncharacterized protein YegL